MWIFRKCGHHGGRGRWSARLLFGGGEGSCGGASSLVFKRRSHLATGVDSSGKSNVKLQSSRKTDKFEQFLSFRRTQAEKSVLIQVHGLSGCCEVKDFVTSNYGSLESVYHYSVQSKGKAMSPSSAVPANGGEFHWLLAEFKRKEDFLQAIDSGIHTSNTVPYTSGMMWFQSNDSGSGSEKKTKTAKGRIQNVTELESEGIISEKINGVTNVDLGNKKSLNEQLVSLEESLSLSDFGARIRFFIACQIESALSSVFPQGCVLPFGSTVSGIGRHSGDLDLVLLPNKKEIFRSSPSSQPDPNQRLVFQSKMFTSGNSSNARFQVQRVMETIADILQMCVPGCAHVQRILQARVPILRFWSDYTEIQCDLSMTNSSGLYMSELIYIMAKLDSRFSTLLFAIRSWASARKITNPVPGRQPTNFMFVLLLIYFFQHKKILPTFDILFNNAEPFDIRATSDGIDCTFLREIDKILKHFSPQCGSESVSELLFQFFEFYSEFDFHTKGISLLTGSAWGKPDAGPLYIQNPLERHLNVARNVSKEEVVRFKSECCSALWKLETTNTSDKHSISLQDLLLTPMMTTVMSESRRQSETGIKVKELFSLNEKM